MESTDRIEKTVLLRAPRGRVWQALVDDPRRMYPEASIASLGAGREGAKAAQTADPLAGAPVKFNDGKSDRQGRFWAGSMVEGGGEQSAKSIPESIHDTTSPDNSCPKMTGFLTPVSGCGVVRVVMGPS